MISRREKLQLFNKLRGTVHAEADLALLEDVNPRYPKLTRFARDPKRYADEILYALLDECDEGDIVDHRIYFEKLNENLNDTSTGEWQEPIDGSSDTSAEGEQESADGSSDTSAEGEQEPKDGSSDASTEEEQIPADGSSNTSTEEETPEGENQQESEQPDAADHAEDSKKKIVQKEAEYPNIDWDNLYNEDVQMATVIYNDRINTWRKMKKLDELLDKKPKANDVAAMAELRIRNLQAFEELKAYNDTGKFLYKHPLLKGKSEFDELVKLFKKDPAAFLHKHKNVLDNIKRYKSYIKRDDRKDKRASDRENLQRHQERERMFKMVMEQYSDKSDKSDG